MFGINTIKNLFKKESHPVVDIHGYFNEDDNTWYVVQEYKDGTRKYEACHYEEGEKEELES